LVTTHLFTTNHCEGLDRLALAECESALTPPMSIANTHSLQLKAGKSPATYQFSGAMDGLVWPSEGYIPHLGCLPMDIIETPE